MMDYQLEDTVFLPFTTRAFATGIPTVLAGTPAIDIYEDATATPIVTGETLVVSLNSVVGFNMITVTATAASGFNIGGHYTAIIQAGTVGGVSVVGEVVAEFTIDNSAAAKDLANGTDGLTALKTAIDDVPTVAEFNARTLVAADYFDPAADTVANVTLVATTTTNTDMVGTDDALLAASAPTNFGDLTITVTTGLVSVGTNNDKTGYSISGTITTLDGLNNFDPATDTVATVTTLTNLPAITANWLTTAGINDGAFTAAKFAASSLDGKGDWNIGKTGYSLSTAGDQSIADLILPPTNTAYLDIEFLFVAASDHVTPVTGATGTGVTRSIDGSSFGAGTGTLAEVANGIYQYDASAADMNGKIVTFRFTGTGGTPGAPDDAFVTLVTSK